MYLYRGVSKRLLESNGGLLKPKESTPFEHNFTWDDYAEREPITWDGGATWDATETNAVIRHQLRQKGYSTSGISTTPHLERAALYARGKDGRADGLVYKIDRTRLRDFGVREFTVSEYCPTPSVPEDDEVILVTANGGPLPHDLIAEVIDVLGTTPQRELGQDNDVSPT